ncbi:uncharacterized protein LOC127728588 isoform X1 [Mytilus californianus]|uniref:uncharacterized protein LOC127728588 isoform X1 n=2 Tax=Mytilus californianus TaxID=6549 RepID=UPI0022478913|nr:uncharacterized protein LOC127728588 isoform X1 [Mytilus californianus]XP_052092067.1 uncharacterized protein LOC127728588 isoform X1 [Mytilus californianus]
MKIGYITILMCMYEVCGQIEVTKNNSQNLQGFNTQLVEKQRTASFTRNGKYKNRRTRRQQISDADNLWFDLIDGSKKDYSETFFSKITDRKTKLGPMKFTCKWDNKENRREQFEAAFIEFKKPDQGAYYREYDRIVAMNKDEKILWSDHLPWPKKFDSEGELYNTAVGKISNSEAYLDIYASRMKCENEQGWYRCTVFVKRPGNEFKYQTSKKKWMLIPCMVKYGRFKSKVAWGAGGSDSNNLDQFFFEMKSVSGDVLKKRSSQKLVDLTGRPHTYKYNKKTKTIRVHECRPSSGVMQKATYILGFVFEFKRIGEDFYQPIAGISDRGNIVWSESVYWQQNYLCKADKTRCPTAYGSVTENPSFTLITSDCKKNEGYYKCHIFVQFAGSPASEQIESEVLLKSPDCGAKASKSQPDIKLNKLTEEDKKQLPPPIEKEENYTDIYIGVSVGTVLVLIVGYLVWSTKKKMQENKDKEQKLMLLHREKMEKQGDKGGQNQRDKNMYKR